MSAPKTRWTRLAGAGVAATLAAVVGLGAMSASADSAGEQKNVSLGGAQSARVEVKLDAGELKLHGGAAATDLLSGSFDFESDSGKPEFDYAVTNGRGELKVKPEDGGIHITWPWDMADDTKWDIALNDTVATDLKVDVNAGKLDLALGGTAVTNLEVDADAAKAEVDLSGSWTHDLTADLKADAGQLVVVVPTDVGVRVETNVDAGDKDIDGLNEVEDDVYVNDAYATATVKLTIKADVDAGQLRIKTAE
ncbi:MAG: hypothetical protein QOF73_446 [Thermomicrobiales bacterium]|nr:hypothetical protein [Thermomicrobiales bacterium]